MIIDTHAHLNFAAFNKDREDIIKRTLAEEIFTINVGTRYETSKKAVDISKNYERGVYCAVGLHPMYAVTEFLKIKKDENEGEFLEPEKNFNKEKYKELFTENNKILAIGEIGLDYYYKPKSKEKQELFKEKQKEVFVKQLDFAKELNLPVILHCRVAHKDMIEILKERILSKDPNLRGVVHSFVGTVEEMKEYIKMGFYIGFNGIIFKLDLDEVIKNCPLEKMVFETDCPYLTPPQEKEKRNEPAFIKHTISKVAELKNMGFSKNL